MAGLVGKNVAVVGASGSVGREVVRMARDGGAHVLAIARNAASLGTLASEFPGITTLAADATEERSPELIFSTHVPDVVVLSLGVDPPLKSVQEQSWEEFSTPLNVDLRASFILCRAALLRPLAPGSTVILISSGAGIEGSPISGGYAGAKRMQMFLAEYCQEASDRLNLGIRFFSVVPRIMAQTALGKAAVAAYSRYRGISEADFIKGVNGTQTPEQVAEACITLAVETPARGGNVFSVSAAGIEEVT